MAQTVFSDALRSFFPSASGQSFANGNPTKTPSFLIDNLLKVSEKESQSLISHGFSPAHFSSPGAANDMRFLPQRNVDMHSDGVRLFPQMSPAFFPGTCVPFPYFPAALHDVRFMQGARMEQNFPNYGYKGGMHMPLNGMHPFFQPSRPLHKRKGGQVRFSNDQTLDLEKKFKTQKYLTPPERKKLAKSLTLSERQIKTWFQNRRAKWRRLKHDGDQTEPSVERDSSSSTTGQSLSGLSTIGAGKPSALSSVSSLHDAAAYEFTCTNNKKEADSPTVCTTKLTNKPKTNSGHKRCTSSASITSEVGQEMCNSDSESVCSDDRDEEDDVDVDGLNGDN